MSELIEIPCDTTREIDGVLYKVRKYSSEKSNGKIVVEKHFPIATVTYKDKGTESEIKTVTPLITQKTLKFYKEDGTEDITKQKIVDL